MSGRKREEEESEELYLKDRGKERSAERREGRNASRRGKGKEGNGAARKEQEGQGKEGGANVNKKGRERRLVLFKRDKTWCTYCHSRTTYTE